MGFFMGIVCTFAILYFSGFVPKTGNYELVALKDHDSPWIYEIIYNTETGQVVSREANLAERGIVNYEHRQILSRSLFQYRWGEEESHEIEVVPNVSRESAQRDSGLAVTGLVDHEALMEAINAYVDSTDSLGSASADPGATHDEILKFLEGYQPKESQGIDYSKKKLFEGTE